MNIKLDKEGLTIIADAAAAKIGRGVKIYLLNGEAFNAKITAIRFIPFEPLQILFTDDEGYHDSISILKIERID